MLRILQKFSVVFIGYLIIVLAFTFPTYNYDRMTGPNPLDLSFPFYLTFGLFWLIVATIWIHEQMEDKNKGYEFLMLLPVKAGEIVGAKFAAVFITVFLYVVFHLIAFWSISSSPDYVRPSWTMMINAGNIGLLIAGILYLNIYRFGFSKMRIAIFVLMIVFIALPIILSALLLPNLGLDKYDLIDWMSGVNWLLVTAVGLAGYFGMFLLSAKLFKAEKCPWRAK
jgi:hypothetical protein